MGRRKINQGNLLQKTQKSQKDNMQEVGNPRRQNADESKRIMENNNISSRSVPNMQAKTMD